MSARAVQKKRLSDLGEFGLIDRIKKQISGLSLGVHGIGDDAAVVPVSSKKQLLLTTDMLLEGVHFTRQMPARGIGHKSIAASISDIAAMGGIPKYAVVSLGAPASSPWTFISSIYQGMRQTARKFGIEIVGGDTIRSPKIIINVALTGEAARRNIVYRGGARPGDRIFVSGPLGGSLASAWHLRFVPRVAEAQYLVNRYKPTSMIDISDGLVGDLGHILAESRAGAVIEESLIPIRPNANLKGALYDGEDFELLFTLPRSKAEKLKRQDRGQYRFYPIGRVIAQEEGLRLKMSDGRLKKLNVKGYAHF